MIRVNAQQKVSHNIRFERRRDDYVATWFQFQTDKNFARIDERAISCFFVLLMKSVCSVGFNL